MLRLRSADWLRDVRLVAFDPAVGLLRLREHLTPRTDTFTIRCSIAADYVLTWGCEG